MAKVWQQAQQHSRVHAEHANLPGVTNIIKQQPAASKSASQPEDADVLSAYLRSEQQLLIGVSALRPK